MKKCVVNIPITWDKVSTGFFQSFLDITRYDIQTELREKYDVSLNFMVTDTFPIDRNRNEAVEMALEQYQTDYILFLDADQVFPRQTIPWLFETLFNMPDYSVVSGVYFKKQEDNHAVLGSYAPNVIPETKKLLEQYGFADENGQYLYYRPHTHFTSDRPFPIDVSGMGCLLVKVDALRGLKQPFFRYFDRFLLPDWPLEKGLSEDMYFFCQLKKAGVKVICDPRIQCGHLKEAEVALVGDAVICA